MTAGAKAAVRDRMRARRAALDPAWAAAASRAIAARILALPALGTAATVAAYYATAGEPDLDALIVRLRAEGRTVAVPAYDRAGKVYRLSRTGDGEPVPGRFGVREPVPPRWLTGPGPDLWLVPGVAFDHRGRRLGQGGGCYDRLLAGSPGARIGIAFSFQLLDEIPAGAEDVPMDRVVTEREVLPP